MLIDIHVERWKTKVALMRSLINNTYNNKNTLYMRILGSHVRPTSLFLGRYQYGRGAPWWASVIATKLMIASSDNKVLGY